MKFNKRLGLVGSQGKHDGGCYERTFVICPLRDTKEIFINYVEKIKYKYSIK